MNGCDFDIDRMARHDRLGPRYTSYPTAMQFDADFNAADYLAAVQRSRERAAPLALYLHLPFCAEPCFYCACTRVITRTPAVIEVYVQRLEREIDMQGALFSGRAPVQQLHLGGGTPSYLSLEQLGRLMRALDRAFGLSRADTREFSIEIDPRALRPETIAGLADLGFNRMSVGVQDFDAQVQLAINRQQSVLQTLTAIEQARAAGFGSISVDLIYGLPRQRRVGFARTLERVVALEPDRISLYSYAHLPTMFRAQTQIDADTLPTPMEKLSLLALGVEWLQVAGYQYIGMDHFARPEDELAQAARDGSLQRNFQGYSTHGGADLLALGMSAISRIADVYCQNAKTVADYQAAIDSGRLAVARGLRLSREDQLRREVIESIMCRYRVDYAALEQRHGIVFRRHFTEALAGLAPMVRDRLVELDDHELRVTVRGRYLLRAVAMAFDAYLPQLAAAATSVAAPTIAPRYSRVI